MTGPSATPGRFEVEAERWFALTAAPEVPVRGTDAAFVPDTMRAVYRQNSRGQWRVWWIEFEAGEGWRTQRTSLHSMSRAEEAEHAWALEIAEAHMPEGRVK